MILRRIPGVDHKGHFNELVSDTGTDATSYTDDTVSAETRYTYRIKAINEHGVSERSRWFHVDTPAAPEAVEDDDPDEQGGEDGGAPPGPGGRANVSEGSTDLPNNNVNTYGEVDVGGSVTGGFRNNQDADWFKTTLEKDMRYQIDLEGKDTNRGTEDTPKLRIFSEPNTVELVGDTDGNGVGNNARLVYTPSESGDYFLSASGGASRSGRTYTLSVILLGPNGESEAGDDFHGSNINDTDGVVDVGFAVTGYVKRTSDKDLFRVEVESIGAVHYRISLEGEDTERGSVQNPILYGILDSDSNALNGSIQAAAANRGIGRNDLYNFAPPMSGTYYLQVGGGGAGSYRLSVQETLVAVAVPPGGLGPSEVPGAVRNVDVSYSGMGQIVRWDAPDETETGAQWITEFRIYGSASKGCGGYLLDEYEVEHPGFTTPPEHPDGTPTGFKYLKIVNVGPVKFGVAAVNELGEGPCVEGPEPPDNS